MNSSTSNASTSAVTTLRVSRGVALQSSHTIDESGEEWNLFVTEVASGTESPVRLRVVAQNERGWGDFDEWPRLVFGNCRESEFLSDNEALEHEWRCRPCPTGAVCGGSRSDNVTARHGFWRVPWARLAFVPCKKEVRCEGWSGVLLAHSDHDGSGASLHQPNPNTDQRQLAAPRQLTARSGLTAANTDSLAASLADGVPRAVPGLQLIPHDHEGCAEGYNGVLCDSCADGHFQDASGSCSSCGSVVWGVIRFLLLTMAIFAALSFLLLRATSQGGKKKSKTVQVLKVVATHLQTVALVAGVGVDWPGPVRHVNTVASASSTVTSEGLSLECILDKGGKDIFRVVRTGVTMLGGPLVLIVYTLVFWAVYVMKKQEGWQEYWRRVKISVLVLAFLLHAPMTKMAFQLVTCERVAHEDNDDDSNSASSEQHRLSASLDVVCTDPSNLEKMLGLSLPVFLIVSIGIPLGASLRIWWQQDRLDDSNVREIWGFFFLGFRPHAILWESLVMVRKVSLAAVTVVLAAHGPLVQIAGGIFVTVAFSFLHAWVKPYDSKTMNRLEMGALVSAALTLFVALLLVADATSATIVASIVIISANLLFLVVALAIAIRSARKSLRDNTGKGSVPDRIVAYVRRACPCCPAPRHQLKRTARPLDSNPAYRSTINPIHEDGDEEEATRTTSR